MNSSMDSSLSSASTQSVKKRPAYLRYTILWFLYYARAKERVRTPVSSCTYLEEASHFVVSGDNSSMGLRLNFLTLVIIVRDVPSTQSGFSLPVLQ